MGKKPFDLQLFAEGENLPPADPTPAAGAKTFTQEDVNNLIARESKSAVEKLLKDAGIAAEGDYKASLAAFKGWQDSQKSELEKATGAQATLAKEKADAVARADALERQLTAVGKGIPADKSAKYIKLAEAYMTDKVDFAAALDLAVKDFPVVDAGVAGKGGNPAPTEQQKTALPKGVQIF